VNPFLYQRAESGSREWDLKKTHNSFSVFDIRKMRKTTLSSNRSINTVGLVDHDVPLNLTLYLVKETELVPWEVALKHLRSWEDLFR
jgi:hypothetical protein